MISEVLAAYLANRRSRDIESSTLPKYKTLTNYPYSLQTSYPGRNPRQVVEKRIKFDAILTDFLTINMWVWMMIVFGPMKGLDEMSRYSLEPKNEGAKVGVGYDALLDTYFLQIRQPGPYMEMENIEVIKAHVRTGPGGGHPSALLRFRIAREYAAHSASAQMLPATQSRSRHAERERDSASCAEAGFSE